jgi:hypothetical protein
MARSMARESPCRPPLACWRVLPADRAGAARTAVRKLAEKANTLVDTRLRLRASTGRARGFDLTSAN